jgi:hypothetical protein
MKQKDQLADMSGKDQNLVKLEAIKTMTWHSKDLITAFEDLN